MRRPTLWLLSTSLHFTFMCYLGVGAVRQALVVVGLLLALSQAAASNNTYIYATCHGGSGSVNNVLKLDLSGKAYAHVLTGDDNLDEYVPFW